MAVSVGRPTAAVRRRLSAVTDRPVWAVLAAAAVAHLAGLSLPVEARYGLLLATLVVLGLPHGALDHLTPPRANGDAPTLRWVAGFSAVYLAVAVAYGLAWFLAPTASFLFFLLLTWLHWGQGDRAHLAVVADADHVSGWVGRLTIAVRGGLPMLVPLLAFPERYRSVLVTAVELFAPDGAGWVAPLFRADVRLALGVGFAALTLSTLYAGYRVAGATDAWRTDAAETGLLWAFFLAVPPVLAIGLYFALWHSLRHLVRLLALDSAAADALESGADGRAVWRLVRDATPMTVGALLLFGGLALAVPQTPGSVAEVGGLYLVLLAVVTLPHVGVVTWLDRKQGL